MKLLASTVLVTAIVASLPVLDGYYVRHIVLSDVNKIQDKLKSNLNDQDFNLNFEITNYRMGYYASDVDYVVSVTTKDQDTKQSKTDTFNYTDHIVHGPIVKFNNHWTAGLAVMDVSFNQADIIKLLKNKLTQDQVSKIPNISGMFSTWLSLSGSRFDTYFDISPVTLNNIASNQKLTWDGMNGEVVLAKRSDKIAKIDMTMTIGKFSAVDNNEKFAVEVSPIQMNLNSVLATHDFYNGNFKISTDKVSVNGDKQAKKLVANNIALTVTSDSAKDTYGYRGDMTVAKMEFPVKASGLNTISNLKYHGEINNLSLNGYQSMLDLEKKLTDKKANQFETVTAAMDLVNAYFKLLTSSSNVVYQISSETNLGKASLDMNISLDKLPLNYFDLAGAVRVKATASAALPLVKLIEDSDAQTRQTIDKLVANQLLVKNNNDYVLDFNYSSSAIKISGKDFKDFSAVDKTLRQIFSTN